MAAQLDACVERYGRGYDVRTGHKYRLRIGSKAPVCINRPMVALTGELEVPASLLRAVVCVLRWHQAILK